MPKRLLRNVLIVDIDAVHQHQFQAGDEAGGSEHLINTLNHIIVLRAAGAMRRYSMALAAQSWAYSVKV